MNHAEDIAFCASLIGKPWVSGATGPDAFDCWGLLRHTLKERRGLTLCPYGGVKEIGLAAMLATATEEAEAHWEPLDAPEHLCGVGMSRGRRIEHVGLWLASGPGGIFHAHEAGGVVFQPTSALRTFGFQHFMFYRFRP